MAITGPVLVSRSYVVEEALTLRIGAELYIAVITRVTDSIRRQIEIIKESDLLAGGPLFYNLKPLKADVLQHNFARVSLFHDAGNVARLYWNPTVVGEGPNIRRMELDFVSGLKNSGITAESFQGVDPFVMDARTGPAPARLFLLYCTSAGANEFRVSTDLGTSWGSSVEIDPAAALVRRVEGNFTDLVSKNVVQVLQKRDV